MRVYDTTHIDINVLMFLIDFLEVVSNLAQ